jgi:cysteine-rich repeat protein
MPGETIGETPGETVGETPGETIGETPGETVGETPGETIGETPGETPLDYVPFCGDGFITGSEECDDGDALPSDGCDEDCLVEEGWVCDGEPSVCRDVSDCGDGAIEGAEACDDGNVLSHDGCDAVCQAEDGWTCSGEPSTCELDETTEPARCTTDGVLWQEPYFVYFCPEASWGEVIMGAWYPQTGHHPESRDGAIGAIDAVTALPASNLVALYTSGGCVLNCISGGTYECMTVGRFSAGIDFDQDAGLDLVETSGASLDVVHDFDPETFTGTSTDNYRFEGSELWRVVVIDALDLIAASDPTNRAILLVAKSGGTLLTTVPTTYPVFGLAAAGTRLFFSTNGGMWGGSSSDSNFVAFCGEALMPIATITVPSGGFMGVDAWHDAASGTTYFAAATEADGIVAGLVDGSGGECHVSLGAGTGYTDVAVSGYGLVGANGTELDFYPRSSYACTPP